MNKILAGMGISRKLLLISIAYLLPIGTLVYHVIEGVNANINFAASEMYGNE